MYLLFLLRPFYRPNRADFPTLSYPYLSPPTSFLNSYPLVYLNTPYPLRAEPPCIGHYKEYPPLGNRPFVSLTLQKTPKIVSAEVATVLRFSRFANYLEFQPLESGTSAPTDDVYRNADPFAYCAANNVAKASGSCKPKAVWSFCGFLSAMSMEDLNHIHR